MIFIIVLGLVFLLLIFGAIWGFTHYWDEPGWSVFFAVIVGVILFFVIKNYIWENNKKVFYVKPTIVLLKTTDTTVRYLIDNDVIFNKKSIAWLNTNNIYWMYEYYKSKTNKKLIVTNKE